MFFLEHLIFLGSEKYPGENEFEQFMQKGGGFCNADTGYDETTFYFRVREQFLNGGLDRFSHLFKAPLLRKVSMMREREAVDSEYSAKKNSAGSRRHQILALLSQPSHPFGKFSCGNLKTLKENVDDEVLCKRVHDFKQKHYSAHRMCVCVQSIRSLDSLQVNESRTKCIFNCYPCSK